MVRMKRGSRESSARTCRNKEMHRDKASSETTRPPQTSVHSSSRVTTSPTWRARQVSTAITRGSIRTGSDAGLLHRRKVPWRGRTSHLSSTKPLSIHDRWGILVRTSRIGGLHAFDCGWVARGQARDRCIEALLSDLLVGVVLIDPHVGNAVDGHIKNLPAFGRLAHSKVNRNKRTALARHLSMHRYLQCLRIRAQRQHLEPIR